MVLERSSCRFSDFALHHKEHSEKLAHIFPHNTTRVHWLQQQNYAQQAAFSQSFLTSCSQITVLYIRLFFLRNVSFTSYDWRTLRVSEFWTKNTREIQRNKWDSKNVTFWCAVHANGVAGPSLFNCKKVRGVDIIKFWTLTSGQKLYSSHRMEFSSR